MTTDESDDWTAELILSALADAEAGDAAKDGVVDRVAAAADLAEVAAILRGTLPPTEPLTRQLVRAQMVAVLREKRVAGPARMVDTWLGPALKHAKKSSPYTPSKSSATAQPPLAAEPSILPLFVKTVTGHGLVGEDKLAKLLYLVFTSRLLDKQVSAGLKGHSASGKSWTVDVVVRFFPRDSYISFTAMSERALIYSDEEYAHRTIVIYEVVALREGVEDDLTSYLVRSLLSEGRIEYPVTVRDPEGGFTTKTIIKEGPTNLVFTTTKTRVHAENETRILSLNTDDSNEQTRRVFVELAKEAPPIVDGELEEWLDLQRWLEGQPNKVAIPYATTLVKKIPPMAVRLRRDVGSLLALVRSHAVLHQVSRDRDDLGRIVATFEDYEIVRELVAEIMAEGVGATVSATVRATIAAVEEVTAYGQHASALDVAKHLKVDKSNASRRLRAAADGGYVRNLEDKRGKPGRWVIGDPLPEATVLLPAAEELSGCAVAAESEGEGQNEK